MRVTIVTSESNPQIKALAALRTPRGRRGADTFLIEGFRVVAEAARAGLAFKRLVLQNEVIESDRARDLFKTGAADNALVLKVPRGIIRRLALAETPQGVVAEVQRPATPPLRDLLHGLCVGCEAIQDPRNLGLLARTAHAAGATGMVLGPGSADPFHPQAVSAAAGSLFHVPVVIGADMADTTRSARKNNMAVWATAAHGGTALPEAVRGLDTDDLLLVFGNEGAGLSPELEEMADTRVTIPMPGGAESLNIAVAAAVILFAVTSRGA